jgi:hypothetical protein
MRALPLLFLAVASALLPAALVRAGDTADPPPAEVLRTVGSTYRSLGSLSVMSLSEVPVPPAERRVYTLEKWKDNEQAGLLRSGVWLCRRDYRIVRDRAVRFQSIEPGMRGTCRIHVPGLTRQVNFHGGLTQGDHSVNPLPAVAVTRYLDGSRRVGDPLDVKPALSLPIKLFHANPDEVLKARRVELVKREQLGGSECFVMRLSGMPTILRDDTGSWAEQIRGKFRFRTSTWTVWIDPSASMILRADAHEEWETLRPGHPDGEFQLSERYLDQRFNPELTPEHFGIEAPDAIAAPEPMKPGSDATEKREP